jgi:hypothetical protein
MFGVMRLVRLFREHYLAAEDVVHAGPDFVPAEEQQRQKPRLEAPRPT